jgi:hypothetical protein
MARAWRLRRQWGGWLRLGLELGEVAGEVCIRYVAWFFMGKGGTFTDEILCGYMGAWYGS